MSEPFALTSSNKTSGVSENWNPQIVAIVCNWCTYAGADLAGTTRHKYPPNVRILRVPCSGRVNPLFMLKAFEQGADGVLVSGCHPGDCHYVQGNYYARRRFAVYRTLIDFLGVDPKRLHFSWVSASEGTKWAQVVDSVTAEVREAGPLRDWGKASLRADVSLTEPAEAPRPLASEQEVNAITTNLRSLAARLLSEKAVSSVLGYVPGSLPGTMIPAFINRDIDAQSIGFNERCYHNLPAYLRRRRHVTGKTAVIVKACDVKAIVGLLQEEKLKRDELVLIGVSCAGVSTNGALAYKCYSCAGEVRDLCDWTVSAEGVYQGATTAMTPTRQVARDPRDIQIEQIERLPREERWSFWQEQFELCIRCYACRGVCPMCYCKSCISEQHRPQWISTAIDGKGNTAWNVVRAFHLAGRCVGCDECSRVCPANIRLDLLNRRLAIEIEKLYGYRAGEDMKSAPPLAAFSPEDPQEFIL